MLYKRTKNEAMIVNGYHGKQSECIREMDIQSAIYLILAQRLFEDFDSKIMVEWAVEAMQSGYESESLVILAGLDYESRKEREQYFRQAARELKLNVEKETSELISDYVNFIAKCVLNQEINPKRGLEKMMQIYRFTDYDAKYSQFYELDEDLDILNYNGYSPIFNVNLTLDNADDYIVNEFRFFLQFEELEIEDNVREMAFCNDCKQITKPRIRSRFRWKKPFKYQEFVCNNCESSKIDVFNSQVGRKKILEEIKKSN